LWYRKSEAFCVRPFTLHRQQPEEGKQKVDFAPPLEKFLRAPMIAVFSLSDAEICNAIRSYEKLKVSKKKKRKDLAVLAKTQPVKYIFLVKIQSSIYFSQLTVCTFE